MEHKIAEPNARVDVADVLRGLAVMGIILLHSIEHFNFYSFPEKVPFEWMNFTDQAIWRGLFFTFSNKAYAVFALLFGFSFYIQDNNQQRKGKDFRLRFLWRLFILFIIGQFNAAFFTGEILTMYAILGIILPIFCRMSDRIVVIFATLLILQPIDWAKLIYALCNPDYVAGESLARYYFGIAFDVQETEPEVLSFALLIRHSFRCTEERNLPRNHPHEYVGRTTCQHDLGIGTRTHPANSGIIPVRYAYRTPEIFPIQRTERAPVAESTGYRPTLLLPYLRAQQYVTGIYREKCYPRTLTAHTKLIQQS